MRFTNWLYTVPLRLRSILRRSQVESELDEELRYHLERQIEANLERGMTEQDARLAARRAVGALDEHKEACRDTRRVRPLEELARDLRFGTRVLLKRPGFSAVAIATLAIGIGANTAIFSVVDTIMLRPLPYAEPDRLVSIWEEKAGEQSNQSPYSVAPPNFLDIESGAHSFDQLAVYGMRRLNLTGGQEPERLRVAWGTPNLMSVLGVQPLAGRLFTSDDGVEGGPRTVLIGEALWRRRFGSSPSIVGTPVDLDGVQYTIIGVLPAKVAFPERVDAWVARTIPSDMLAARGVHFLGVVGRLASGFTVGQAQAELDGIAAHLEGAYPQTNKDRRFGVMNVQARSVENVRPMLLMLLAAVGLVLLIACANVANLLLSRIASRRAEIALRAALGARRLRLVRQFLTESMLLALSGSVLGVVVAYVAIRLLVSLGPAELPQLQDVALDLRVLGFTLGATFATGVLFGLAPALRASSPDLNEAMKEGAKSVTADPGRSRATRLLVVVEVALSLVLLVGAGLLTRSFIGLMHVDPGFDSHGVLTVELALPHAKYAENETLAAFYRDVCDRIALLPGVRSTGAAAYVPLSGSAVTSWLHVEGRPDPTDREPPEVGYRVISGDYFETLRIPVLRGRAFTRDDNATSPPVVIVSEELAQRFFPGDDAIGRRLKLGPHPDDIDWSTIVGVVASVRHDGLDVRPPSEVFLPESQDSWRGMTIVARVDGDPASIVGALKNAVWEIDPDQPVFSIRTMDEVVASSVAERRFGMALLAVFAALALVLAAVGLYSVIAYSVTQRTHEIGVRMALGARTTDVTGMILRQGMGLALLGVVAGNVAALGLARWMSGFVYGISAVDPLTFSTITVLLAAIAFAASYLPARRASRLNPVIALRDD